MLTGKHFLLGFAMLFLSSGAAFAQSNLAVIDSRIAQLEQEIRSLTGKIEEQNFKIKQLETELDRRVSDAELRIGDLEKNPASTSSSPYGGNAAGSTPVAIPPSNTQQLETQWGAPSENTDNLGQIGTSTDQATLLYEEAFATLRNGNYDMAEQQFQAFLDKNSGHSLTNNARYWLAETFYVRNQYDRAAKGFATAYQNDPNGPKAADNLLKLGLSLAGLGKNEDACVAFSQLLGDFSTGPRSIVGRAERESTRLGCSS
jgi:tol-pal system protein YbgF